MYRVCRFRNDWGVEYLVAEPFDDCGEESWFCFLWDKDEAHRAATFASADEAARAARAARVKFGDQFFVSVD
jgi:hypothetical protein